MFSPRNWPLPILAVICVLSFAYVALAQETSQKTAGASQLPTELVVLNVLVTDSSNHSVNDLRAEEIRVTEDGKPQNILYFSSEPQPVSYGIVVDASGSMRALMNHIIEAGRGVIASNKPGDEAFVMRFVDADNIDVLHGLTSNRGALEEALDSIYVEGGLTAVNDAITQAVDYLKKNKRSKEGELPRRAIVLITDGEDRGSRLRNQDLLLNRLREEGVQFFIIGLSKISNIQSSRDKAANFLRRVAAETGGRAFFPESPSDIPGIVGEITRDLHTQYVIGYTPTNVVHDGSFRKIQVTVPDSPTRKKLNVTARPGYTAPRQ